MNMKISVRLLLLSVVVLAALALNACSGVQAAQGSQDSGFESGLNDLSLTSVPLTASVNFNSTVLETATPDVSGTPSNAETPDVSKETPSVSETPDAQHELVGMVTAMDAITITINGVVYKLADLPAFAATLKVGDKVKVKFITNADGSITVREINISSGSDSFSNSNDTNSNDSLSNSSNSNDGNNNDHMADGSGNSNDSNGNGNSNSHDSSNSNENEQNDVAPVIATP